MDNNFFIALGCVVTLEVVMVTLLFFLGKIQDRDKKHKDTFCKNHISDGLTIDEVLDLMNETSIERMKEANRTFKKKSNEMSGTKIR